MTDIVEFLTARLDEREQRARQAEHAVGTKYDPLALSVCETVSIPLMELYREAQPAHVLAAAAAKRRVLERHCSAATDSTAGWTGKHPNWCLGCGYDIDYGPNTEDVSRCPELRDMASIDAGHPDYNPTWSME